MSARTHQEAVFTLTRGYSGFGKLRFARLIMRNRALRKLFRDEAVDYLIFHEGNITPIEQALLGWLSGIRLRFVDVGEVFKLNNSDRWTGASDFGLGYSLMCRFNYQHVWHYLEKYELVYRVDEDVVVISLPRSDIHSALLAGCLSNESHSSTNSTLPVKLSAMGLERFYNHRFPYTNCYVTKMAFWRRVEVQAFLRAIGEDPLSVEYRWGDLPVIGVALQSFGLWDPGASVDSRFRYIHGSHRSIVKDGYHYPNYSIRVLWKELGWIGLALLALDRMNTLSVAVRKLARRL